MEFNLFKKYVDALEKATRYAKNVRRVLEDNSDGSTYYPLTCEDVVVDLLEEALDDDKDWIAYFCYGRDFGKRGPIRVEVGGERLPFNTVEDLYDVLTASKVNARE